MDLGVHAVATRAHVDGALAALDRGVQLNTVERGTFKQSGRTFVVRPIVHTRCSRARHDTLIPTCDLCSRAAALDPRSYPLRTGTGSMSDVVVKGDGSLVSTG